MYLEDVARTGGEGALGAGEKKNRDHDGGGHGESLSSLIIDAFRIPMLFNMTLAFMFIPLQPLPPSHMLPTPRCDGGYYRPHQHEFDPPSPTFDHLHRHPYPRAHRYPRPYNYLRAMGEARSSVDKREGAAVFVEGMVDGYFVQVVGMAVEGSGAAGEQGSWYEHTASEWGRLW